MSRAKARQTKPAVAESQVATNHGQNPTTTRLINAVNAKGKGKGKGKAGESSVCSIAPPSPSNLAIEPQGALQTLSLKQSPHKSGPFLSLIDTPNMGARLLHIRKAISILFMLTDCPKTVVPADIISSPQPDSTVSIVSNISLTAETRIVEDFTFLSSTTTDPLKVRALCLEKCDSHPDRFLIRISSNHGELETVMTGLKGIIGQLKDDPPKDNRTLAVPTAGTCRILKESRLERLLQSIVALNFNKILCRLQSKHAFWRGNHRKCKAGRAPILTRFFDVLRDTRMNQVVVGQVTSVLQTLKDLFRSFEDEQTTMIKSDSSNAITSLTDIVKCIYYLWRVPDCCAAISSASLLRQVSKIARYVTVMFSLLEHRRQYPWVGLLEVELARLNPVILPPVYQGLKESAHELLLTPEVVEEVTQKVRCITEHVGKSQDETFVDLINAKCAVHAEIQLLFYYELRGHSNLPRVILSTKAPCFLCALFFTLHGRYRTPDSHGRLYEKWTFPSTIWKLPPSKARRMNDVTEQFVAALLERIIHAISTSKVGRLASYESLFAKSAIWARLSRAPSLVHMIGNSCQATNRHEDGPDSRNTVLRQLWCSTAMLVTSNESISKLGRGRHAVFRLDDCRADQTAIRTDHLNFVFSSDSSHGRNLDLDEARPKTSEPLLVKVGRPEIEWERARPSVVVDVSNLEPGEEVVIVEHEPTTCTNFAVKHKEDYVLVQIQSTPLVAIG